MVITGKKRPQVSRKTVSVEESRRVAPGGAPAQVVKLLLAFRAAVEARTSSCAARDSRYYIDALEVPFIFHGIGNLSVVPSALMSEVDFVW